MGEETIAYLRSKIYEDSQRESSKIIDRRVVEKIENMVEKAIRKLKAEGQDERSRKALCWLAWNRSEARFWEIVETSAKKRQPIHYCMVAYRNERYGAHR